MTDSHELKNPIALFPLPDTVFFPGTELPLHIFEPRYRQMTQDALDDNLLIGMVLLKPGYEEEYFEKPAIEKTGCAGRLVRADRLPDGKFNIQLKGLSRFRILEETGNRPYRMATVEYLESRNDLSLEGGHLETLRGLVSRLEDLRGVFPKNARRRPFPRLADCSTLGQAADLLAYSLDWDSKKLQAFLEELDAQKRMGRVASEIDLKIQILRLSSERKQAGLDINLN